MKKRLTLLVDEQLVERMKLLVSNNGLSLAAVVEQFFAQQLAREAEALETSVKTTDDAFIAKFGGILSDYSALTDLEIREMIYSDRIQNHA
jgi:hypothetical protein